MAGHPGRGLTGARTGAAVNHVPFVYLLRCIDNSLYVGSTTDLSAREQAHNAGTASIYTAARRPVRVIYHEHYDTLAAAIRRERQLKRWTAGKKEALVRGDTATLKLLSKRRST